MLLKCTTTRDLDKTLMRYRFRWAWVDGAWQPDVAIDVDDTGVIRSIQTPAATAVKTANMEPVEMIDGVAVPGMVNLHSHAFQWALAGRSELRTRQQDSFWTWREQMFRLLESLDAELMYRIARDAYGRMVQMGYTAIGEFHYVHLDPDGGLPEPLARYGDVLVQAALDAGLAVCLLPALYQRGGFDETPLVSGQRRFRLETGQLLDMIDVLVDHWSHEPRVRIGLAIHSLRAVAGAEIQRAVRAYGQRHPTGVIHIHAAEQMREVEQCLQGTGRRPVEWILDELAVDQRWCLIHATHTNAQELERLAAAGAVVGLCPMTEANLGDGIFRAEHYLQLGGRWGIGSDSQVCLNPQEELRMLEYGQRLTTRRRAVLADAERSCGEYLYPAAAAGGAQALGIPAGTITIGHWADWVVLDLDDADASWQVAELNQPLEFSNVGRVLDRFIFTDRACPRRVMTAGRWRDP